MKLPPVLVRTRAIDIRKGMVRSPGPDAWIGTWWLTPILAGIFYLCGGACAPLVAQISVPGVVMALANESASKTLIGGTFDYVNGEPYQNLGRLNYDGTLDSDFLGSSPVWVYSVVVDWDERILVGGIFSEPYTSRFNLHRLHANGTPDSSFGVRAVYTQAPLGRGAVAAVVVQPDGKILVGGGFDKIAGQLRRNLARLHLDGTVDTSFNPTVKGGRLPFVSSLALQPDGRILVGGIFKWLGGGPCTNIGRLNADGTLDTTFRAKANDVVRAVCLQPEGYVLIGGAFSVVNGRKRTFLARLLRNGELDTGFNASIEPPQPIPAVNGPGVYSIGLQSDGRMVIGGRFVRIRGVERKHFARINPNGTLDLSFDAFVSGDVDTSNPFAIAPAVYGVTVQPSATVVFGGHFNRVAGEARRNLAWYRPHGEADCLEWLEADLQRQTVTWDRCPNSPELESVIFEQSTDGTNYVRLGLGTRIYLGWQIRDLTLPPEPTLIRARGRTLGGVGNRSSGLVSIIAQL